MKKFLLVSFAFLLVACSSQKSTTYTPAQSDRGSESSESGVSNSDVLDQVSDGGRGGDKYLCSNFYTPPNSVKTRLESGGGARVTFSNGKSLRLRDGIGTSSNVILSMPEGTKMTVLHGPHCDGHYIWWKVRTTPGDEGFAAESNGTGRDWFLEPWP